MDRISDSGSDDYGSTPYGDTFRLRSARQGVDYDSLLLFYIPPVSAMNHNSATAYQDIARRLAMGFPGVLPARLKPAFTDCNASSLDDLEKFYADILLGHLSHLSAAITDMGGHAVIQVTPGLVRYHVVLPAHEYIYVFRFRGVAEDALELAVASLTAPAIGIGVSFSGLDRTIDRWLIS